MSEKYGPAADDSKYAETFLEAMKGELSFLLGEVVTEPSLFSGMLFELKHHENHQVIRVESLDLKFCIPVWGLADTVITADEAYPKNSPQINAAEWLNCVVGSAHASTDIGKDLIVAKRVLTNLVEKLEKAVADGYLLPKPDIPPGTHFG